ncbi:MAG: ribbon-helix-helix protein, CopG family [Polyangiaceae bacterium]|nr:ribbon-helix-helix protein, CopG family [Polyangiaceae bacterium]
MPRSEKVAVSLNADLLRQVERVRTRTGESRSAIVARALRLLTKEEEHARLVHQYVDGYRRHPETPPDVAAARTLAERSLAALPWDEE